MRVLDHIPHPNSIFSTAISDPETRRAPYNIYNIGNHQPVELMKFIHTIEDALGRKARKNFLPLQGGDVISTYADIEDLKRDVGFEPTTPLNKGIERWVEWYLGYTGKKR